MSLIVLLDNGPLELVTNPKESVESRACKDWLRQLKLDILCNSPVWRAGAFKVPDVRLHGRKTLCEDFRGRDFCVPEGHFALLWPRIFNPGEASRKRSPLSFIPLLCVGLEDESEQAKCSKAQCGEL